MKIRQSHNHLLFIKEISICAKTTFILKHSLQEAIPIQHNDITYSLRPSMLLPCQVRINSHMSMIKYTVMITHPLLNGLAKISQRDHKSHVDWWHLINEEMFKIVKILWNSREIMFNFVVSTMTADDLAPLGAGSSADTAITIYVIGT